MNVECPQRYIRMEGNPEIKLIPAVFLSVTEVHYCLLIGLKCHLIESFLPADRQMFSYNFLFQQQQQAEQVK